MDIIQTLMAEHRLIDKGLDALEAYATALDGGIDVPREDLGLFAQFIREYADTGHHGKEEDILFAIMNEHGFPRDGGPVGVMLVEHDEGRRLVGILREIATTSGAWSGADRARASDAAHAFVSLLKAHIYKEDNILYPMAERHLPPGVLDEATRRAVAFDQARAASGETARLEALARDLASRYGQEVNR